MITDAKHGIEVFTVDGDMPPFGVTSALLGDTSVVSSADMLSFWLLTHHPDFDIVNGPRFWRTAVIRECLPAADAQLDFVALAEPLT